MTGGFSWGVVGEGGFSTVYLGRVGGSDDVAVKVHRGSELAFRQELEALLRVRHPHIVRLLAFCPCDQQQAQPGVLVLDLAPNGNLHDHLHRRHHIIIGWPRRLSVALQVARALEYLHRLDVVHGDVKASNVLLDAAMAARLCDFGSARAAGHHGHGRARRMLGSPGYVDPHYLRSGVLTAESDVYSFGVLLLELLTGVQPFRLHLTPPLLDARLGCSYDAAAVMALAAACVGDNPSLRPTMADVVRTLERAGGGARVPVVIQQPNHRSFSISTDRPCQQRALVST
ncbi:unnamed protein product [Urochloa humidicola]